MLSTIVICVGLLGIIISLLLSLYFPKTWIKDQYTRQILCFCFIGLWTIIEIFVIMYMHNQHVKQIMNRIDCYSYCHCGNNSYTHHQSHSQIRQNRMNNMIIHSYHMNNMRRIHHHKFH